MSRRRDDEAAEGERVSGGSGGVGRVLDMTVGRVGRALSSPLNLFGTHRQATVGAERNVPGTSPGIEHMADRHEPPDEQAVAIRCIDYCADRVAVRQVKVAELVEFLQEKRDDWVAVRWIDVQGLHPWVVDQMREAFGFHSLAAEDVLHTSQRPRMEPYADHLYIVMRMLRLDGGRPEHEELVSEQVSMFAYDDTVLTFQEEPGDPWEQIRERLRTENSRLRRQNAAFLLYSLLDAVVDHAFPILEHYGEAIESLEEKLLKDADPKLLAEVHLIKRDLLVLRRVMWPMRQLVDDLRRDETERFSEGIELYFRDVYEHAVQVIDIIETYREMSQGLTDLYMSAASNRLNEVMKVLAIIATMFVPLTFLAGMYGMNFEYIPETQWRGGYFAVWGISIVVILVQLWLFRRKGWI